MTDWKKNWPSQKNLQTCIHVSVCGVYNIMSKNSTNIANPDKRREKEGEEEKEEEEEEEEEGEEEEEEEEGRKRRRRI